MATSTKYLTVFPGTLPQDGALAFVAKASSAYGGFTVKRAWARTGQVGTLDVLLLVYSTASPPAIQGTIGQMASGTATVWASDTPQEIPITSGQEYVDSDEWLVIRKDESAANNDFAQNGSVVIEIVEGIASQG